VSNRFRSLTRVAVAVYAGLSLAPLAVGGQVRTAAAKVWAAPRTAWGDPDLQGMWRREGVSQFSLDKGPYPAVGVGGKAYPDEFTQDGQQPPPLHPEALKRTRPSGVVDPPDGRLPWQPWAAAKRQEIWKHMNDAPTLDFIDPHILCMPPGVPRSGAGGYQFVQSRGLVVLIYEFNHIARLIRLDGQPRVGQNIHLFMGDSRGRWDGDTLVVDTTNFTDKTWFDMVGTFHSDALHVVERFTMVDADMIDYEATFEDPNVFTRPWKLAGWFPRAVQGYEPYEYACAEGNHNLDNVISQPSR
jgi:hypothetical protein